MRPALRLIYCTINTVILQLFLTHFAQKDTFFVVIYAKNLPKKYFLAFYTSYYVTPSRYECASIIRNRRKNAVFVTNAKWVMIKKNLRISVAIKRLNTSKRKKLRI